MSLRTAIYPAVRAGVKASPCTSPDLGAGCAHPNARIRESSFTISLMPFFSRAPGSPFSLLAEPRPRSLSSSFYSAPFPHRAALVPTFVIIRIALAALKELHSPSRVLLFFVRIFFFLNIFFISRQEIVICAIESVEAIFPSDIISSVSTPLVPSHSSILPFSCAESAPDSYPSLISPTHKREHLPRSSKRESLRVLPIFVLFGL